VTWGYGDKIEQGRRAIRLHFSVSRCVAVRYVNPNNTEYLASLDAINGGGTIRCWVIFQPQFANLYPRYVQTTSSNSGVENRAAARARIRFSCELTSKVRWRVFERNWMMGPMGPER